MNNRKQQEYNQAINLISHLILTKPNTVVSLVGDYGIRFKDTPNRQQLVDVVIKLMGNDDSKFIDDLGNLVTIHIQKNGKEMLLLQKSEYNGYFEEGEEDEFWGAIAKGAIGFVGRQLKKRKDRRNRRKNRRNTSISKSSFSNKNTTALTASRAEVRRVREQAARTTRDLNNRILQIQKEKSQLITETRREKARLERENKAKLKELKEDSQKSQRTMFLVATFAGLFGLVGFGMWATSKKPATPVAK